MALTHPAPWFAICALCLVVGGVLAAGSPFFRARLAESSAGRYEALDGLRGFLALAVFGDHAVAMYHYHVIGQWLDVGFYQEAAYLGVSLFFVITGYLFWLRVLRAEGRLDTRAFFVSRLRRLVPMYAASVLFVLVVAFSVSGPVLNESPLALLKEIRAWASFGFQSYGAINGFADAHHINAVYWTLAFEWAFYIALPFLALFARGGVNVLLYATVLFFGTQAPIVFNFLAGALAAALVHSRALQGWRLDSPWLAPVPLAALAAYFVLHPPAVASPALFFVFFVFVVHGQSLFGLLRSAPAKVLGTISYSIYLMHCIVLFVVVRALDHVVPVRTLGAVEYWLVAALAAALTVLLSALTYACIEYPFISPKGTTARRFAVPAWIPVALWKPAFIRT